MKIQKEQLEILTTIITFLSSLAAIINVIFENYNVILYISIICLFITGIFSCILLIKRYPVWKRYYFIRYLFFEVKENKFNIAPKVLLFLDIKKKKNKFEIETLSVNYTLTENDGVIDSDVLWILNKLSNVKTTDFYFYAGIDLGKMQSQEFVVKCNDFSETRYLLQDNQIDSENDIFLYHWDIPDYTIKNENKVDEIRISMKQKNSFDFNNKEVIYLFPWNFAKKVENINFKITYPITLGEISMQLFEVGKYKEEKFPFHHSIDTSAKERFYRNEDDNTITYEFCLKKDINIENLYYILLHKTEQ